MKNQKEAKTMATEEKLTSASFGKLFLAFSMVLLLALFVISMQTSAKLKESNEKKARR